MSYREFRLGVTIADISDVETGDSAAIKSLFALLGITPPETSLAAIYDSFYDCEAASTRGSPAGRGGRGDVVILVSDSDNNVFLAVDMYNESTDQMNAVGIEISAPAKCGEQVAKALASLRSTAEVYSALLDGNLGVRESLAVEEFPRVVNDNGREVMQNVHVFRGGRRIHSSAVRNVDAR